MAGPPPGFVIDGPQNSPNPAQAAPGGPIPAQGGPPPGFVVDQPQQAGPVPTMEQAGRFAQGLGQAINPIDTIKSVVNTIAHPVQAYQNDVAARQAIGQQASQEQPGLSRFAHRLEGMVPMVGPGLYSLGQKFEQGNEAGGLGQALGMAGMAAAPEVIGGLQFPGKAAKMYQDALNPTVAMLKKPGNVAKAVQTGLDAGITVAPSAMQKIGDAVQALEDQQAPIIANNAKTPISLAKTRSALADVRSDFAPGEGWLGPEAQDAIDKVGEWVPPDESVPASQAFNLKRKMGRQIGDAKFGQQGTPKVEALKSVRYGMKEALYEAFPELGPINAKESGFLALEPMMEHAVNAGSKSALPLDAPSMWGAAEIAAGHATGGSTLVGASVMRRFLSNPKVRSYLAIKLAKGPGGMAMANARIAAYADSLGNVANDEQDAQNGNETPQVRYGTTPDGRRVSQGPDGSIQYSDQPQ